MGAAAGPRPIAADAVGSQLKQKKGAQTPRRATALEHSSLLLFSGRFQRKLGKESRD